MPYLHLDTTTHHATAVKRDLAKHLGGLYAEIMQTTPDLVNVTYRELGEGNVWNCGGETPRPAAILSCEIRRGRPPEQRERLARALLDACVNALGLDPTLTAIEMTQHAGDENYLATYVDGVLQGALGRDWTPDEIGMPLMEQFIAERRAARSA